MTVEQGTLSYCVSPFCSSCCAAPLGQCCVVETALAWKVWLPDTALMLPSMWHQFPGPKGHGFSINSMR